ESGRMDDALVILCAAAGVISNPAGVSLPFVILLVVWWRRGAVRWFDFAAIMPMLAMSLVTVLVRMCVDAHYLGGLGPAWAFSPLQRVLAASRALWFYAGKLLW